MKYRIRLWDFDGTLADTGRDVWNSIQYAAKKCGGEIDRDYMKKDSNLGKPLAEIFEKVMPYPGKQKFGQFEQLVRIHYREISMYEETYLYHGIAEILESAEVEDAADYVITMKPKSALERILETKGWSNLFTDCLSPDSFDGKEKKKTGNARHPDHRSIRCTSGGDSFMDHSIRNLRLSGNEHQWKNSKRSH